MQVERQVLGGNFMVDAHDAALEQRPDIFDAIGVDAPVATILAPAPPLRQRSGKFRRRRREWKRGSERHGRIEPSHPPPEILQLASRLTAH